MTREEAIKVLSSYDVNDVWADVDGKPYNAEEQAEAVDMAIEALQAEPKTKCVARIDVDTEEVVKRIKEEYDITDAWHDYVEGYLKKVRTKNSF